ncbi:MAG: YraN family protein [Desulfobaccales bacterium]
MIWKRKSARLPEYDYSQEGAFFVTVCVQNREGLLGRILNGEMHLNQAGSAVARWWKELERKFPPVKIDEYYVVMPNHFHGIVVISELSGPDVEGGHAGPPLQKIVQWFKTMSTNEYIHGVKEHGWKPFKGQLWQRSFYEHVIRNDEALNRIREYIKYNPQRWDSDRENPRAKGKDDFDRWLSTFTIQPSTSICRSGPACPPSDARRQLGDHGEDLAAAALKKQGYKILERNYTTPLGEIDLIARHDKTLVIVEVKTRKSTRFGSPQEAVSAAKQAKLRRLADYYMKDKRLTDAAVRFDVVAILLSDTGSQIEIIVNAF